MGKRIAILAIILALIPQLAYALQLHWASGANDVTFSAPLRCTLELSTDFPEGSLPKDWRLVWVARNCSSIAPFADSTASPSGAAVCAAVRPQTAVDQKHHMVTAEFAEPQPGTAVTAVVQIDLPAAAVGNIMAVALLPNSDGSPGSRVVQSNIVTFNGGLTAAFPPVVLATEADHSTSTYSVQAKGIGLSQAARCAVSATDLSWTQRLPLTATTDSTLEAATDVPIQLPDGALEVETASGMSTTLLQPAAVITINRTIVGTSWVVNPEPGVALPKDFAFFYNVVPTKNPDKTKPQWRQLYHLIYIRHLNSGAEVGLGHAWSEDLSAWRVDTAQPILLSEGPGGSWDESHVWAPSVVQHGNYYYMFYTGVAVNNNQSTGYVKTQLLDTTNTKWELVSPAGAIQRTQVMTTLQAGWTTHPSTGQQFRDPYVFGHPNPDSSGVFYMVYTASDNRYPGGQMAVGLAENRAPGNLNEWVDRGFYKRTGFDLNSFTNSTGGTSRNGQIESPHIFPSLGTPSANWRIMYSWGGQIPATQTRSTIQFTKTADATVNFADTSGANWTGVQTLVGVLNPDTTASGWNGTEYLKVSPTLDFLAGFNTWFLDGIHIAKLNWTGTNFAFQLPNLTSVDEVGSRLQGAALKVLGFRPGVGKVTFELGLPTRAPVRLAIYDVSGRVVRTLVNGGMQRGVTRLEWDRRDAHGTTVASGMYYARMNFDGGSRTLSLPLVR